MFVVLYLTGFRLVGQLFEAAMFGCVRSHVGRRGERNILYKSVKLSPSR